MDADETDNEPVPFDLLRPSHDSSEPYVDTGEAARQLGISRQAVAQAIQKRTLAGYGIPGAQRTRWYVLKSALEQRLREVRAAEGEQADRLRKLQAANQLLEARLKQAELVQEQLLNQVRNLTGLLNALNHTVGIALAVPIPPSLAGDAGD